MAKDILLVLLGVGFGVLVKALVDPWLAARSRKAERRERWLENGLEHAEAVLGHLQEVRSAVTAELGFDSDQIAREMLRSLTPTHGPDPLIAAAEHESDEELRRLAAQALEAWRATRIAFMDDQQGAVAMDELHEPLYALQWYTTALRNFASTSRLRLGGRRK